MERPVAQILVVGNELLVGDIADRNGPHITRTLTEYGFQVGGIRILPDWEAVIEEEVAKARAQAALVVVCGGLGPTSDDRTTESVARAFGRKTVVEEEHWAKIREVFKGFGVKEPPPGNEKQATILEGSHRLNNEAGLALGYVFTEGDCRVAVLPGPPKENRPMLTSELLPWLDRAFPGRVREAFRVFRVFGRGESEVSHRLQPIETEYSDVDISYRFTYPEILVRISSPSGDEERLEAVSKAVVPLLSPGLYGTGEETLPGVVGRELAGRGLRVVTVESCTGGLAAKLLTDTPGSSAWMDRGFVVYSNAAKEEVLGVPSSLLAEHGAVSEPVARSMLSGALDRTPSAHVGFAITGTAGPDGGTPERPVGTVCFAWGDRERCLTETRHFHWDRTYNRLISAWIGIYRVYQHVLGVEDDLFQNRRED